MPVKINYFEPVQEKPGAVNLLDPPEAPAVDIPSLKAGYTIPSEDATVTGLDFNQPTLTMANVKIANVEIGEGAVDQICDKLEGISKAIYAASENTKPHVPGAAYYDTQVLDTLKGIQSAVYSMGAPMPSHSPDSMSSAISSLTASSNTLASAVASLQENMTTQSVVLGKLVAVIEQLATPTPAPEKVLPVAFKPPSVIQPLDTLSPIHRPQASKWMVYLRKHFKSELSPSASLDAATWEDIAALMGDTPSGPQFYKVRSFLLEHGLVQEITMDKPVKERRFIPRSLLFDPSLKVHA